VDACAGENIMTLHGESLQNISNNVGQLFLQYAIRPYWTVCFAAPSLMANVTSDPLSPVTQGWWAAKAEEIKALFPTFAGFLVKADCEGNAGPQSFNRTEADGANMMARALRPIDDTVVIWRTFIYGGDTTNAHEEKAKQEYDTIHPLDGMFEPNVILQIKHTPMDFLIRDPVHPLLAGGLTRTSMMMEAYTGGCDTGERGY
jgi:alpha-glucuronidase